MNDTAAIDSPVGRLLPRLRLMRLPNAVTAVADVLAGGALAGVPPVRLIPLACAALLLYAGGCVLNDLHDREIDRTKHPHRPLPAGLVSPAEAAVLTAALFTGGLLTASLAGARGALAAAVLLSLVLLYDLAAKRDSFAGPAVMGSCRGAAVVLGMSPALPVQPAAWLFPAASLLYVFALSTLARWEGCSPDRRPPPLKIALPAAAAVLLLSAGGLLVPGFHPVQGGAFLLLFLALAGRGLTRGLQGGREKDVAAGVEGLILGIPFLDAVACGGSWGWWSGFAATACALPAWVSRRRFYIT